MDWKFDNSSPLSFPAWNFLSPYYFFNNFLQKFAHFRVKSSRRRTDRMWHQLLRLTAVNRPTERSSQISQRSTHFKIIAVNTIERVLLRFQALERRKWVHFGSHNGLITDKIYARVHFKEVRRILLISSNRTPVLPVAWRFSPNLCWVDAFYVFVMWSFCHCYVNKRPHLWPRRSQNGKFFLVPANRARPKQHTLLLLISSV